MNTEIRLNSPIRRSARVLQLLGMFDLPPAERSEIAWSHELPIEEQPWSVGLIVGPSGCGKSTLAREMFGVCPVNVWSNGHSLLDDFPAKMPIKEIVVLLSSVGFSSPPSWLRPFGVLSTGEQFRVSMARTIAENESGASIIIDEFTSTVDRTVAQIGSAAIAKTVRARGQKFIAVTCHYDVIEWLDPDWIYDPSTGRFQWRELHPRPSVHLTISRIHHSAWSIFAKHHYLSGELSRSAACFAAFLGQIPVAFHAFLPFVGRLKTTQKAYRTHRTVCLPDFQGIGIGNATLAYLCAMWKGLGYRFFLNTGHPAMVASARRSADWEMTQGASRRRKDTIGTKVAFAATRATDRLVASFEWVGRGLPRDEAYVCMNSWGKVAA